MKSISFRGKGIPLDRYKKRLRLKLRLKKKKVKVKAKAVKKSVLPDEKHLKRFWTEAKDFSKRLNLLIELSNIVIPTKEKYIKKRIAFDNNNKIRRSKKCFVCRERADVRHHIILLKNGGRNRGKNIVCLCNKCHGKIHSWLVESVMCADVAVPSMSEKCNRSRLVSTSPS